MSRPDLRGRWRDAVFATSRVSPVVKVTLLALADKMSANGTVSTPREDIAKRVGKHPRKVSEHIEAAIKAGLLDRISRGYVGHTAEFKAVMPGLERVPKTDTLSVPDIGTLSAANAQEEGAGNRHPIDKGAVVLGADLGPLTRPEELINEGEAIPYAATITAAVCGELPMIAVSFEAAVTVQPCSGCGKRMHYRHLRDGMCSTCRYDLARYGPSAFTLLHD